MSITSEKVAGIYLVGNVAENFIIAVGDDCIRKAFKYLEVIYHPTAEECGAILKRRFIDDHLGTFSFNALHDTLYRRLAKIIAVGFHSKTKTPPHTGALGFCIEIGVVTIAVISRHTQYLVGDKVFTSTVTFSTIADIIF